ITIDFFFFQAEDGIRDRNVTGVQTCALPIFCLWTIDCLNSIVLLNQTHCTLCFPVCKLCYFSNIFYGNTKSCHTSIYQHNVFSRSEEHTSELQSRFDLVCRLLPEKNERLRSD